MWFIYHFFCFVPLFLGAKLEILIYCQTLSYPNSESTNQNIYRYKWWVEIWHFSSSVQLDISIWTRDIKSLTQYTIRYRGQFGKKGQTLHIIVGFPKENTAHSLFLPLRVIVRCYFGFSNTFDFLFNNFSPENLYHLFFVVCEFSHSKQFWNDFESHWYVLSNQQIRLTVQMFQF